MIVDLPDPVAPTIATFCPAGMVNERLCKIIFWFSFGKSESYVNETFLNSI